MPKKKWLVIWKRNRIFKGKETTSSEKKAKEISKEKKDEGYKEVSIQKLPRCLPNPSRSPKTIIKTTKKNLKNRLPH